MNVVKTDVPGLVKDTQTGAVLNTDGESLKAYKLKKKLALGTEARLQRLEQDMGDIKQLLLQLVERTK